MITFPNAKINLGLNIVEKRPDGYHNLETVFYPIAWEDALEVVPSGKRENGYVLHLSGLPVGGNNDDNLVAKACRMLQTKHGFPPVDIFLRKNIPMGAGLGGGSSDAAFMIKMLNGLFHLGMTVEEMEETASSPPVKYIATKRETSNTTKGKTKAHITAFIPRDVAPLIMTWLPT